MENRKKHQCPCCGCYTQDSAGEYDICPVCFWEDDPFQRQDPDDPDGANHMTLREARENYEKYGACKEILTIYVRPPYPEELPPTDF